MVPALERRLVRPTVVLIMKLEAVLVAPALLNRVPPLEMVRALVPMAPFVAKVRVPPETVVAPV